MTQVTKYVFVTLYIGHITLLYFIRHHGLDYCVLNNILLFVIHAYKYKLRRALRKIVRFGTYVQSGPTLPTYYLDGQNLVWTNIFLPHQFEHFQNKGCSFMHMFQILSGIY